MEALSSILHHHTGSVLKSSFVFRFSRAQARCRVGRCGHELPVALDSDELPVALDADELALARFTQPGPREISAGAADLARLAQAGFIWSHMDM